jgi:hypothetical protein
MLLIDFAADQPRQHHHPEGEQPPVELHHHREGDEHQDEALHRRNPLLGPQERLPQQNDAQMCKEQRPRPWIRHATEYGDVQEREHGDDDQPPVTARDIPGRIGEPVKGR